MHWTDDEKRAIAATAYEQIHAIQRDDHDAPLTLEDAIRSVILKSSSMVQWRDDALNIMYCTLGAGIDWNDQGRLADRSRNNYLNLPPKGISHWKTDWLKEFGQDDTFDFTGCPDDLKSKIQARHDERIADEINAVLDIDNRCQTYRPVRTHWYPISWYSPNLAAPVNAQDDFLQGAIETATLMAAFEPDWLMDNHWRNSRQAREVAIDILQILKSRTAA